MADRVVASDQDSAQDLYSVSLAPTLPPTSPGHTQFERLSTGVINGNGADVATFRRASSDGSRVLFETEERLVALTTSTSRKTSTNDWTASPPASPGARSTATGRSARFFAGASTTTPRRFLHHHRVAVAGDTDVAFDTYERSGNTTTQVTAGAINGNGAVDGVLGGLVQ